MFMQTHLKLARVIYQTVQKDQPDVLDYASFLVGNVLPDFDRRMLPFPHFKDQSFGYLVDFIQQYRGIPADNREMYRFSCDMGMIAHFICDYFCQAHNYSEYENLWHHILYETQMINAVASIPVDKLAEMSSRVREPVRVESVWQLPDFIDFSHQQYKKEERDINTDIVCSLKAAATVITTTINYNLGRELAKESYALCG